VRHGCQLSADGLHGEIESEVEHGPNFGIARIRRTMISQRTANSGLTGCLSLGSTARLTASAFSLSLPCTLWRTLVFPNVRFDRNARSLLSGSCRFQNSLKVNN
jgi:hypothetical protein